MGRKKQNYQKYIRAGIVQLSEVLPFATQKKRKEYGKPSPIREEKEFLGHNVYMDSIRYQTFAKKGCKCVRCGVEGEYFAVERQNNADTARYHLNLYAMKHNKEVLMTVDHTVPASQGGKREVDNLQPMCIICNAKKSDMSDQSDKERFYVR